jgi:BASS family bile acid:Na+ symporter
MQNGGLASGLAKEMGKAATLGLAPAVFGPLMNITGSILASYWHRKPITDEVEENLELEVIGQKSEVRSQRSEV